MFGGYKFIDIGSHDQINFYTIIQKSVSDVNFKELGKLV